MQEELAENTLTYGNANINPKPQASPTGSSPLRPRAPLASHGADCSRLKEKELHQTSCPTHPPLRSSLPCP